MKFPLDQFYDFCAQLTVDSKEKGQIRLSKANLLGTQTYFIDSIVEGLSNGVHRFVILKGRQEGITTICAALDLFWHYLFPGMQGTFASHNEEARDEFRATLTMYHDGLPKSHKIPIIQNNRYFLSLKNRSKISMQIGGGGKKKGGKGRGKGLIFMHATEVSSWEDEESLASIMASLAQVNPNRLQIMESTARGMNMFKDIWDDACEAVTQKAIFIGWWRNQLYRKKKGSQEYLVYWDGRKTPIEEDWTRDIKSLYDVEIDDEQLAWWRWMIAEEIHDEDYMMQEYPPTEDYAFILSGKNFFSLSRVKEIKDAIEKEEPPQFWRFTFGDDVLQTELTKCAEKMSQLAVWEEPVDDGFYVIGCDPAYGSSSWKDRSVVEVWRCYSDRFEQVAEFCMPEIQTYKFAWVVCALSGYYKNSMLNMEVNGPGQQVLSEIQNLRRQSSMMGGTTYGSTLKNLVGHLKYFLYKRIDSTGGGGVYHWITTQATKDRAMNGFRDIVERGHGVIHSKILADEMKIIVRESDGFLGASGRGKDDCTIASAIAAECYSQYFVSKMKQMNVTWAKENERRNRVVVTGHAETAQEATLNRTVGAFMGALGIKYGENDVK
jgi:hypothetical protein